MRRIIWFYIIFLALLGACNFGVGQEPEDEYPPQTRIIRIDLTPDTVATRDTVLIHCVIEDSMDSRFKYYWGFQNDTIAVNGLTTGPYIRWITPDLSIPKDSIFEIMGNVVVDNGRTDSLAVGEEFIIPVIKK